MLLHRSRDADNLLNSSSSVGCTLLRRTLPHRPLIIGALGTSLTYGTDLPDPATGWTSVLEGLLRARGGPHIYVVNGALRASSADFAALCFDEIFGKAWVDGRGSARAPRLDFAIVEYTWSSSPSQIGVLIESLHGRGIPVIGVLYYHPVNLLRLKAYYAKRDFDPSKGYTTFGRHAEFAATFKAHGVPFVNTSEFNEQHGWQKLIWPHRLSSAHLTPLGHASLAKQLADLLANQCEASLSHIPPAQPNAHDPRSYFCRIGSSLGPVITRNFGGNANRGWEMIVPSDARTPGIVATGAGAHATFSLPVPTTGRFLSLGYERSGHHNATGDISCAGACACAPLTIQAKGPKAYTYLQRTKPRWVWPSYEANASACEVNVRAVRVEMGRLMIKAITLSPPRAGNKTMSINTLYALDAGTT